MKTLVALLLVVFGFIFTGQSQAPTKAPQMKKVPDEYTVGKAFPLADLITIDGDTISSKMLKNKVVVYNIGFQSCPPCRAKMKGLNTLNNKYKDNKDVVILYISIDNLEVSKNSREKVNAFYPFISFENISKKDRKLFDNLGSPHCIIVDKLGKVVYKKGGGAIDEAQAEKYLMGNIVPVIDKALKN